MSDSHRDCIRDFLAAKLQIPAAELTDTELLFSSGRIDSMGAIELIMFLEQRLGLDTSDPDFDPSSLDSVDEIVRMIAA